MLNEQVLVFPKASVAVHVTVVVPGGKKDPDAGEQKTVTLGLTIGSGKLTIAPFLPWSLKIVMLAGQVIIGGAL